MNFGFWRRKRDKELDAEIQSHLNMAARDRVERGESAKEAERSARRQLGSVTLVKETTRDVWGGRLLADFAQDVRCGFRALKRKPGYAVVAVLLLALGVGLNSAMFSAVYAVLLKPLPFRDVDRLIFVWKQNPERGWLRNNVSAVDILEWRKNSQTLEDMAAFTAASCVIAGAGEPEEDPCEVQESNLFPLLGVAPFRGRLFSRDEDRKESPRAAILSYGFWQRRFGGDSAAIGKPIEINGSIFTVVGVMPASIAHLYAPAGYTSPAVWLSGIGLSPVGEWNNYSAIARLRPGASLESASRELDTVSAAIDQTHPSLKGWRTQPFRIRDASSGDVRPILLILLGAVTFVLLIACANVANLTLAHGAARSSEFAMRKALGASDWRLIRQILTESLLISMVGGGLGVLLAAATTEGLFKLAPRMLVNAAPGLSTGELDGRVLLFAFATAIVTCFLSGLAPAFRFAKGNTNESLKESGRSSIDTGGSRRFRDALVIAEIALSMVLLTGAGLMVRTLSGMKRVNLGFNPANVLTMRVPLSDKRYQDQRVTAEFWRRVTAAAEALPGVECASVTRGLPIEGWTGMSFMTANNPDPPAGQVPDANYVVVGPNYFRTLQIPLRAGRYFTDYDGPSVEHVAIVNEELAQRYWPNENAIGKQLRMQTTDITWLTVVGIANNMLTRGVEDGFRPEIYVPYQQFPLLLQAKYLMVRVAAGTDAASLAGTVVQEVHRVDPTRAVAEIRTMEEVAAEPIAQRRMVMALLGGFAGLALILSAVGMYSVLAYSVAQRTREIGVRMALGARRQDVLQLILGRGARLAFAGIVAGIAAALALTQLMTDLLYGIKATDPLTFASVAALLATISVAACYIPARRATQVDPMVALRHE